jgi:hypothetical protein
MPVVEFKAKEGKGWQPLPKGTYILQITSVDSSKASKAGNPQMMIEAAVVGGDHDGKKCTLWYPLDGKAAWRTRNLLEGTGIDFEEIDGGEVDEDGKKIFGYKFDTDDLVEAQFMCDVTQREYEGKMNNDYSNERSPEGGDEAAAKPAAESKAAAATPATQPARTPTAGAATRRPRVA